MKITVISFFSFLFLWLGWRLICMLMVKRLRSKLDNANLDAFKKCLGADCRIKKYLGGSIRCKWDKGWVTVCTEFDTNGNQKRDQLSFHSFGALPVQEVLLHLR